jgi:hypothetical protein
VSLSAAARNVLADFMSENRKSWEPAKGWQAAGGSDEHAVEACSLNMLNWQYEFLLSLARRTGISLDDALGRMVDDYRI